MKKKGFTIIELLAILIVLSIIMLITIPIVIKIIENVEKKSYIESVNGILDSTEKYIITNMNGKEIIELNNDTKITYKGKKPSSGKILIDEKGNLSIIVKYDNYCIEKKFSDTKPDIVEREKCEILDSEIIKYNNSIALNKSNNDCITDSSRVCSREDIIDGFEVSVNVNDSENYTFNVLKDNGDTLDLQINFNIGKISSWASDEDYEKIKGAKCEYARGCNDIGPITVLNNLKELTDKWKNISSQSGIIEYTNNEIDMSYYKARLMTLDEAIDLGCLRYKEVNFVIENAYTCPPWFGTNYHLITASQYDFDISWFIYCGAYNSSKANQKSWSFRPVITVKKEFIK